MQADWDTVIGTKEQFIEMVKAHCKYDPSYVFETEAKSIEIKEA